MAKTKARSIEDCSMLFEIEVSSQAITEAFEKVYNEITKIANIPGFRIGKAPLDVVKKHYASDAREEVLKRLIPEAYREALQEHSITPVGLPEISDVSFESEKALSFKARVDTRPKFKLKDYKGIKIAKKKVQINDADVEKTLENLRELNARYVAAEDRPVQMGDYVVSDLECSVDGKSAHPKRENLWLFIDKESAIPGLADNIVGMRKGEAKEIEVKLPPKYPDKKLVGKIAKYHVVAKEIKIRQLPEINDEFAKDLGRNTLEELRSEIRKEMENRAKIDAEIDAENQLLTKLMDDNVFAVPSSFVTRQLSYMVEDAKKRLEQKGFKKEDLDKKDDEFKEKFKNEAVRQVRLLFILDEIAMLEGMTVNEKDLKDTYRSIATQTNRTEDEVKGHYEKEDLVDNLEEKIREGKTIQFLLKNAEMTEA